MAATMYLIQLEASKIILRKSFYAKILICNNNVDALYKEQ